MNGRSLYERIETGEAGRKGIVITRDFPAPVERLLACYLNAEVVRKWSRPPGWEMTVCEPGVEAGATYRYGWRNGKGMEMLMSGVVKEFVAGVKIVATERFEPAW